RSRQLIWLLQLIRQAMNDQISPDTIAIVDSFPLPLCQSVRNHRASIFEGFKVHMLVTLSGYILNYIVTSASVHDIKAVEDLLEGCQQSVILADLGYLSQALKNRLKQRGYHLWTPLRQNMGSASQHNNGRLLAMRRTIETRFSELCALFDMEHTFARGVARLQLRIEQILLAYNLSYFEFN
ncbi:IS982 family transposase, partial [Streptococcus anginosus]|uniref:IS982 family transposase n=1 Tax=Streptococcus anginosus TaxID=1328 RepID=UPI0022E46446